MERLAERLRLSSAAEQARAMQKGLFESTDLVAAEAAARDAMNPELNAFVLRADNAQNLPVNSSSALSGVSFAVKDNFDVKGMPTRSGLQAWPATPAQEDATAVARLKQAGLVFSGKTNMSPMALGSSTHNPDFGNCYNPLRAGYTAGGSSGGSASAVAAGLTGIALGTDTMGSVRLPAALCGIVGFKPGWSQIPVDGLVPLCRMLDHIGVLCRSVEDAKLAYSILRGPASGHGCDIAPDDSSQEGVRLGYCQNSESLALQTDVEKAYKAAIQRLQSTSHTLVPVDTSGLELSAVRRAGLILGEAELLNTLDGIYPDLRADMPGDLLAMLDFIAAQPAKRVGRALAVLAQARERFSALFNNVDAMVLPTCPHTAFPMDAPAPADAADLTVIANVLGAPAISLPLPVQPGELPAGLQLIGRVERDDWLLALSGGLESMVCD